MIEVCVETYCDQKEVWVDIPDYGKLAAPKYICRLHNPQGRIPERQA